MWQWSRFMIWITCTIVMLWILREKWSDRYHIRRVRVSTKNLQLLTYNIQRFPYSMKPLSSLQQLISSHSIILLQECFLNLMYDDIQYEFPQYHIVKGTMNGYRLVNSGLVTLTKYPIVSHSFVPFETQSRLSSDIFAEKGFLIVLVRIQDQLIYIINTHLQSSNYRNDTQTAFEQWKQLFDYVSDLTHPFVIGGDFNMNVSKINVMPYSLYSTFHPTLYIKYKDNYEMDTSCMDKKGYDPFVFDFFITNGLELSEPEILPIFYSDHLPVSSRIKINSCI